jgi:CheY-like chemotaxis protein
MKPYVLLVVDDEPVLLKMLSYMLGKEYEVHTAINGAEALAKVHEHHPDLIISDLMMPEMDGWSLYQALQEDAATSGIPFIMLSARADNESIHTSRNRGIQDHLPKPPSLPFLKERIRELIEAHIRRAAA